MPVKTSYAPGEPTWIDLGTPDMDTSIAFYGSLFGWTCDRSRSQEFGGYANFAKDGKKVAGIMPLMNPGQPPVWTSYLSTDDADKTAALVTEHGGTVHAPPMDVADLGRMTVLASPDGAFFGAWQPGTHTGAELVHEEGALSWIELSTRDKAAAVPFYTAVFGWGVHDNPGYLEFQQGGTSVAGCMDMPEHVPAQVPSYWMPYFTAQDPAAKAQEAAGLGATVVLPYMEADRVAFSVVADPHGSMFGLLRVNS